MITAEGALQDWLGLGTVTQGELWSIFLALAATIMQVCLLPDNTICSDTF